MNLIRHHLRSLSHSPFVSLVAILSLALGIGANAAIYSLFEQALLQTLPVTEPERLVNLANPGPKPGTQSCGRVGDCDEVFSYPMYRDLAGTDIGLSGLAAHVFFGANLASDRGTVSGRGAMVSASYFPVLGMRPALGRLLGPGDDAGIGESFVVVLSHAFWQARLGGDPDVLNRPLIVNGQSLTVVGVAPEGFTGTTFGSQADVFVPITMYGLMRPGFEGFDDRRWYWAYLFGRLQDGTSLEEAEAAINRVYSGIIQEVEAPLQEGMSEATLERFRARLVSLTAGERGQSSLHGQIGTPLRILFAITGTVLLIACANVANLLLARGARRSQEMAVRASLGASRLQLLRQLLWESCLLAALGGAAGLVFARWTLGLLPRILPTSEFGAIAVGLRPSVVVFAAALSLFTGIAFGLYPALYATGRDLVSALRAATGQPSGNRAASRFRSSLATAQLALSMALLIVAALFLKSLINIGSVDAGLQVDNMVAFGISPELNGYAPEEAGALFDRTEEAFAAQPGITAVAASMVPVLSGDNWGNTVSVEGFESGPDVDANARFNAVSAGYFRAMGMPLLAGREFERTDDSGAPAVAIVNETFARKFGLDPARTVGKRMAIGGGRDDLDIEIVGLVQDALYAEVKAEVPPLYFRPYRQMDNLGFLTFYLRTATDADSTLRAVPAVMAGIDDALPVEELKTLRTQVRENVYLDRMISTMSAAFAVLATVLALIGLYGVLSYTVAQRTREIGLRMALGADLWRVQRMVLGQLTRMAIVGGIIGIGGALLIGRAASSLLFGLEATDPVVIVGVVLLLGGAALGAGYLPARRAARIDPMKALRFE